MAEFIYVDNSNLFIEGKRIAAVKNGKARSAAHANANGISDDSFRLDFGGLYDFVAENNPEKVACAVIFGSSISESDARRPPGFDEKPCQTSERENGWADGARKGQIS